MPCQSMTPACNPNRAEIRARDIPPAKPSPGLTRPRLVAGGEGEGAGGETAGGGAAGNNRAGPVATAPGARRSIEKQGLL
jgi:hypothetical protein